MSSNHKNMKLETTNPISERILENEQLSVFFLEEKANLSNTIQIYDNIPFFVTQQPRDDIGVINRDFVYDDKELALSRDYEIRITPGTFVKEIKKGKNKGSQKIIKRYPNVTDELIEQIIRKLAVEGQSFVESGHVSVAFSLYQIFEELKKRKLSRSYSEIIESIEILTSSQTDLSWIDEQGQPRSCKSSILLNRRWISPNKAPIAYKGKKDLYCVTFHPLVTKSIVDRTFRQFNYERHMSLQNFCARWIHKRMSHNFTWANSKLEKPYHLSLDTIIKGSGIKEYASIYDNIKRVEKSIKELINKGILDEERTCTDRKQKSERSKTTTGAVFNLFPTESFTKDQIAANHQFKKLNGSAGIRRIQKRLSKLTGS
jgi:hypothetical protein